MKNALVSLSRLALLALGFALITTGVTAAETKAPALPVKAAIEKGEAGEHGGHFSAKLTNTSKAALKIKAVILQSVASHSRPRTIEVPEHTVEAGASWSIPDLAAADQVTLTAAGFEPLVVTVPSGK